MIRFFTAVIFIVLYFLGTFADLVGKVFDFIGTKLIRLADSVADRYQ